MFAACLGIVATALVGWSDITVSPSRGDRPVSSWQNTIANLDRPTELTSETLRRYDEESRFRRNPETALTVLGRRLREAPTPELVYTLAELSWIDGRRIEGRRIERRRGVSALERYLDTAAYAWDFLFDPNLSGGRQPSDPRYRLAGDLYNGALDRLIRAAKSKEHIQPGDTLKLKLNSKEYTLPVTLKYSPWPIADVHDLRIASEFEVSGLDSKSRLFGLGVPLIGIRHNDQAANRREDQFYLPETAFPLTAILRFPARLPDADPATPRECTLDLVDPVMWPSLGKERDAISIESDVTTPLAYMWSRTDLSREGWSGLLRPGEAAGRARLMLLRPYEPDKIPIVMVHGLASSPLAWIPMLNELLRDPQIQQRFQFLLYVYPTGVPVPIAASGLRDALLDAQRQFDTAGQTPEHEFNRMIVVGHSMGGLLSHAMAVDSGDEFWKLSSDRSFDDIVGPPGVLAELRHYTFFNALPFVRRVVFLATPHRGSELSRRPVGRISSNLISEPDNYSKLLNKLVKDNPDAFPRQFRHLPTSIDTLETDSEVLLALLKMKPGSDVTFHSIIGSLRPEGLNHTTDGVVAYRSSHFDGTASERVVRSDHGVQKNPDAIREVRRIMLEHVGLVPAPSARLAGPKEPVARP